MGAHIMRTKLFLGSILGSFDFVKLPRRAPQRVYRVLSIFLESTKDMDPSTRVPELPIRISMLILHLALLSVLLSLSHMRLCEA